MKNPQIQKEMMAKVQVFESEMKNLIKQLQKDIFEMQDMAHKELVLINKLQETSEVNSVEAEMENL